MSRSLGRKPLIALSVFASTAVVAASLLMAAPFASADKSAPDEEKRVIELKHENAWVNPKADLQFGTEPLQDVQAAAKTASEEAACDIDPESATSLSIAPTWPEVSPEGKPPSPMTLSRYDTQPELGDPEGRAEGLWFHPGIGIWQMDSAGLGTDYNAFEAMDTQYISGQVVPYIVGKYCDSLNGGASEEDARAAAWLDWHACDEGACEDTYLRSLENVTTVDEVGRHGGGELRECDVDGEKVDCLFVDAAKAQGANWWAAPDGGGSPLAAPFYVYSSGDNEVRTWLAADSGAETDVTATRPFGGNARDSLSWSESGAKLCDTSKNRGAC